jgi:hypothetical protein
MRSVKVLTIVAFAMSLGGAAVAAPTLDAAGKCRDGGKFVKAEMCKTTPKAAASSKCRDIKTKKFAKCGTAGTEAVPAK